MHIIFNIGNTKDYVVFTVQKLIFFISNLFKSKEGKEEANETKNYEILKMSYLGDYKLCSTRRIRNNISDRLGTISSSLEHFRARYHDFVFNFVMSRRLQGS